MYLLNKYQNNKLVDTYDATAYLCDLRAEDVHVAQGFRTRFLRVRRF